MKKNLNQLSCMLLFLCLLQLKLSAQNIFPATGNVGIGTTTPAARALLEVKSTTKGVLISRMTQAQRNAVIVSSAVNGLLIYQTDNLPGFYYYNAGWKPIAANLTLSNLSANTLINANLTPGTNNFRNLGTTTNRWRNLYTYGVTFADGTVQTTAAWKSSGTNVYFNTGNVGIGTSAPAATALLDVKSTTKGVLIPRMTQAQRNVIIVSSAVNGMLIYQTDNSPGFYYYNAGWKPIAANLTLSNLSTNTLINANLTPGTNNFRNLGTTTNRWRNLYTYGVTFADGTVQTTAAWKSSGTNVYFNTGNVGIGTSAPAATALLDVKSTTKGVLIPRMTQAQRNVIIVSSAVNGMLIYQTDNSPGFYYYNAGWKPIGANAALSNLSATTLINASLSPASNNLITLGTSTKRWKSIYTYTIAFPDGTTQSTAASASSQWKASGSNIYFNTGKIGIGTATPKAKLQVAGTDYVSLSSPGYLLLGDPASYNIAMDVDVIQARYNGTAAGLYLNYYGGYTYLGPSGAVAINTTGNLTTAYPVGINGSSNASYALNVNATTSYNGINVTDGVNAYAFNASKSGSLAGVYVSKTSTASYDACIWGNSTGSATGIQGNSVTGIGVYGITGNPANYAGYFLGNVYTSGSFIPSDLTLKKNVKDFTKAIDIINQLHPKIYQYKDEGNFKLMNLPAGDRYGLIAEDVEKVLPNLVKQSKFETGTDASAMQGVPSETIDFKAINYTELIPVLVKGMQEQQSVIDRQQQQINQLQQMVQSLLDAKSSGANLSGAYLMQNAPNPFSENTIVRCYVPASVNQAKLEVYNISGQLLKSHTLTSGMNIVNIDAGILSAGEYSYLLFADGKKVDAKKMIITR